MISEKWQMYIDTLQGHPSVCRSTHTSESMKFITKLIPPEKYPKILNIGAGEGLETYILKELGYDATGIIRGVTNLEYAYENFPNINYVDCDMHDLPFPNETFDAIYMNQTFEHSYAPFIFLLEMYSVLKPHGRVWTAMPHFKEIDDPTIGEPNKLSHHHPNTLCYNLLKQLFESTGFQMLQFELIQNNSYFDNPYLLEKLPIKSVHDNVKTVLVKRKKLFGMVSRNKIFYKYDPNSELSKILKKYKPTGEIIDCGCNIGRWAEFLADAGYKYTGVDQSNYAIENALQYHPNYKFICKFLWDLDYEEKFDIAIFNVVLQHNSMEEKIRIIPKIYNALKKDGILIINESTTIHETETQMTYNQWIYFIESFGFRFKESWNKNELGINDHYIFMKETK